MNIILLLVVIICLYKIKFAGKDFFDDYISKDQTNAINGLFVVLVFLRHFKTYIEIDAGDMIFGKVDTLLGQLIVVSFLFYSGYGIMVSINRNERGYITGFLFRRFFKVWYHFALAIVLFIIANIIIGQSYSIKDTVLAFTAWKSIGNSAWYVFAVLCLYMFVFVSFEMFGNHRYVSMIVIILLCAVYIVVLHMLDRHNYWYNTIFTFPAGMLYGMHRETAERIIQRSNAVYAIVLIYGVMLLGFLFIHRSQLVVYELMALLFAIVLVVTTMKVKINNAALAFLGKYTFEIYILQRIPMLIFSKMMGNKYLLLVVCFIVTVNMAIGFKAITTKTDQLIYGKTK